MMMMGEEEDEHCEDRKETQRSRPLPEILARLGNENCVTVASEYARRLRYCSSNQTDALSTSNFIRNLADMVKLEEVKEQQEARRKMDRQRQDTLREGRRLYRKLLIERIAASNNRRGHRDHDGGREGRRRKTLTATTIRVGDEDALQRGGGVDTAYCTTR